MSTTHASHHDASLNDAATSKPTATRPILLVLDFDGTLTTRDTMHLVADAGYAHQKSFNATPQPRSWSEIVDAYMADFKAHTDRYTPRASERYTPEQELAWLNSLQEIEEASILRACDAGIFNGVTSSEMDEAGRRAVRDGHVRLREGWHELIRSVDEHNNKVPGPRLPCRILSVNWSATFIQGVVWQASEEIQPGKSLNLDRNIYANEIPSISDQITDTQKITSETEQISIRTSEDKVKLLRRFRDEECRKSNALLTYVGDSSTDLGCLLEADISFCIQDEPMGSGQKDLAETCQRIGIDILPSTQFDGSAETTGSKKLWSIKDFLELQVCLRRNDLG